jgi:hypothetical protein
MVVILTYEREKLNEKRRPKICKNYDVAKRKEKFKGKRLKQMTHVTEVNAERKGR